jgi:hypothetical protein
MATITISDETYQRLAQKARATSLLPDIMAEKVLQTYLEAENEPSIHTLGDLLVYGYGLWADPNSLDDTLVYAAQLRAEAWQRQA